MTTFLAGTGLALCKPNPTYHIYYSCGAFTVGKDCLDDLR